MPPSTQGFTSLPGVWAHHARHTPDRLALVCGDQRVTWAEFGDATSRTAHGLRQAGLRPGDVVAVLMSSSAQAIIAYCGVVVGGCCLVPVNTMLTGHQVLAVLEDSGAGMVVVSPELVDLMEPIRSRLAHVRADGFVVDGPARAGWRSLDELMGEGVGAGTPFRAEPEDLFSIMYSSGTTGAPKGIVHTHAARTYFCQSNGADLAFDADARALASTGLYTAGTWIMVMPVLFAGGTLHILPRFTPAEFLRTVAAEGITHAFVVPSQIGQLLEAGGFDDGRLSSLQVLLSAGSSLRPDLKARVQARLGHAFHELYGYTEGGATLLKPRDAAAKPASVGAPLTGQRIAVIGQDDRRAPPDEPGEIATRSPGLMLRYHNQPAATAAATWHDEHGHAFIRSGDIGTLDRDGFLFVLDRKKDMIISGGLNVFPADVEAVLGTHPAVLDVAVIGVEHPKWGETPVAVAVLREDGASLSEILLWANARLARHQRLSCIHPCEALPRNGLGKVLKRELRAAFGSPVPAGDRR